MNELSYLNKLTSITNAYRAGDLSVESLNQHVDELMEACDHPSEDFFVQLQKAVQDANLQPEVSKALLDKIAQIALDYSQTQVVDDAVVNNAKNIQKEPVIPQQSAIESDNSSPHITGNSSLLRNLLNWQKTGQEKSPAPDVIIRGTYRLVSKLGEGGMGEVWKAIDLIQDAGESRDRYVAIKFLNQSIQGKEFALKALVREFARYKKLIHPNLVRAYELNRDENLLFIVMEFLPGISLDKFIKNHPNGVSLNKARPIIKGMCHALEYSHQEGVIHLDFKPSNVFYNPETNDVKVIDFGIARLAEKQDRDLTRFDPGVLGAKTKAYATPEMMIDADPHPCDDVYGLSCVIYEVLTGRHPFKQLNVISAEANALKPKPVRDLNKSQIKALENGLAFHRKDRTQSAGKLYQEIFPKLQPSWHLSKKSLATILVLLVLLSLPLAKNQWDSLRLQNITEGIAVQNSDAIHDFHQLKPLLQRQVITDDAVGASLVQFYISIATPEKTALDYIQELEAEIQEDLLHKKGNRKLLVTHSVELIEQSLNKNQFNLATKIADQFATQYPDSKLLASQIAQIEKLKQVQLVKLNNRFTQCLNDTSKSLVNLSTCLTESAQELKELDPARNVLKNPQLSERFIKETRVSLETGNIKAAEQLILMWNHMLPMPSDKREMLTSQLNQKKIIEDFTAQFLSADSLKLSDMTNALQAKEPAIRLAILQHSENRERLINWYTKILQDLIENNQYHEINALFEQVKILSDDHNTIKQWLVNSEKKVASNKQDTLDTLTKRYNSILKHQIPEAQALMEVHQRIKFIDSDHQLLEYPRVSETYADKAKAAIKQEQFDLAQRFLQDWHRLRPEDAQTNLFQDISKQFLVHSESAQKRSSAITALQNEFKNNSFDQAQDQLRHLTTGLSDLERKLIMERIKPVFIQSFSKQFESTLNSHDYASAFQLTNIALKNYPDEQLIITKQNKVNQVRNAQIETYLTKYQNILNAESLNGSHLFEQLKSIDSIDNTYLVQHPEIYQTLSDRLKSSIATEDHTIAELNNIFVLWENFLSGTEDDKKSKSLFGSTKNYVALQCLIKAKILKKEDSISEAQAYINFGLSLNPSNRIRESLKEELDTLSI